MKYIYLIVLNVLTLSLFGQECIDPRGTQLALSLNEDGIFVIEGNNDIWYRASNSSPSQDYGNVSDYGTIIINPDRQKRGRVKIRSRSLVGVDLLGHAETFSFDNLQDQNQLISNSSIQFWVKSFDFKGILTITDNSRVFIFDNVSGGDQNFKDPHIGSRIKVIKNSHLNIQTIDDITISDGYYQCGEVSINNFDGQYWNPFDYSAFFISANRIHIDVGSVTGAHQVRFFRGSRAYMGMNAASGGVVSVDQEDASWLPDPPNPWSKEFLFLSEFLLDDFYGKDGPYCNLQLNANGNNEGWDIGFGVALGLENQVSLDGLEFDPIAIASWLYETGTMTINMTGTQSQALYESPNRDCYLNNKIINYPHPFHEFAELRMNYSCNNLPLDHADVNGYYCGNSGYVNEYRELCLMSFPPCSDDLNTEVIEVRSNEPTIFIDPFEDMFSNEYPLGIFNVTPNPASDVAKISYKLNIDQEIQINLIDIAGRLVSSNNIGMVKAEEGNQLDLNLHELNLNSGTYIVQIIGTDFQETKKLMVSR